MADPDQSSGKPLLTRRNLLIGGGAGVGLLVAWAVWPRHYAPNLTAAKGEHVFGAWLKIGEDGHVTVAVPQAEHGQGVWTTLPQIVADELGADWRTIAVEPAPLNPLYANPLAADELFEGAFDRLPKGLRDGHVTSSALMLTARIDLGPRSSRAICATRARRRGCCCRKRRRSAGASTGKSCGTAQRLRRARQRQAALRRACGRGGRGKRARSDPVARRRDRAADRAIAAAARQPGQDRRIGQFRRRCPPARHGVRGGPRRGRPPTAR